MKGILIDSKNRRITLIEFDEKQKEIASLINCQCIDVIALGHNYKRNQEGFQNDLWIDDEFLLTLKNGSTGFFIDCFPQPIFGNGLVLVVDLKNGASRSTTLELQQLVAHINFCILVQTPYENVILKM